MIKKQIISEIIKSANYFDDNKQPVWADKLTKLAIKLAQFDEEDFRHDDFGLNAELFENPFEDDEDYYPPGLDDEEEEDFRPEDNIPDDDPLGMLETNRDVETPFGEQLDGGLGDEF